MDCRHLFEGKKITVLGLGVLGRAVGDAEFLAQNGAFVTVTDKKNESELFESVERLRKYPNVTFHLGGHQDNDFIHADMVVKAAGVRLDSPEIALSHKSGVQVVMSTALFALYAVQEGAKVVGVTGTRGKSTTTQMIYESLRAVGGRDVLLGGNVRGVSTLAMLPQVQKSTIAVLELDSWQLQGFGELKISPQVAVFTNLMPDHQNYYPDMGSYFSDKANIYRFQKQGDTLVVGESIMGQVRADNPPISPTSPDPIPSDWVLKIPGVHNRENAALASAALTALGVSVDEIKQSLESF